MQWDVEAEHPDYVSEDPNAAVGRCLDERVFNGKKLGPWLKTCGPARFPTRFNWPTCR